MVDRYRPPTRRDTLPIWLGILIGLVAAAFLILVGYSLRFYAVPSASAATEPGLTLHLMMPGDPILISGHAGEEVMVHTNQYGVPATAKAVLVRGFADPGQAPSKVWVASDKYGKRAGLYVLAGDRSPAGVVPLNDDGTFCVMGSGEWNANLTVYGWYE